ncbi:hypothetical protein ACP4OV_009873 [Aristida adscensionis]
MRRASPNRTRFNRLFLPCVDRIPRRLPPRLRVRARALVLAMAGFGVRGVYVELDPEVVLELVLWCLPLLLIAGLAVARVAGRYAADPAADAAAAAAALAAAAAVAAHYSRGRRCRWHCRCHLCGRPRLRRP